MASTGVCVATWRVWHLVLARDWGAESRYGFMAFCPDAVCNEGFSRVGLESVMR